MATTPTPVPASRNREPVTDHTSPLENADAAKRERDITGEISALMQGHSALENAPWYPVQAGDIVHIHYPALRDKIPAWGETYLVEPDKDGFLVLRSIAHTAPSEDYAGAFAPGLADDPLMEMWMEAGPHALVVIRHGRIIHGKTTP